MNIRVLVNCVTVSEIRGVVLLPADRLRAAERRERPCAGRRRRRDADARHDQLPAGLRQAPGADDDQDIDIVRDLITSITGGDLYVRSQASAAASKSNVTSSITNGMGAVRDLDVSADGTKVVFSLRLPLNPNKLERRSKQPNWHIYQYDAVAKRSRS
jgi:hypothetical protein